MEPKSVILMSVKFCYSIRVAIFFIHLAFIDTYEKWIE